MDMVGAGSRSSIYISGSGGDAVGRGSGRGGGGSPSEAEYIQGNYRVFFPFHESRMQQFLS